MEVFGIARASIDGILQQGIEGREKFREADCETIAHIKVVLEKLQEISPSMQDDRVKQCLDSCAQAEAVLRDLGWAERLRKAQEDQAKIMQDARNEMNSRASEPLSEPPELTHQDRAESKTRLNLLMDIDNAENHEEAEEAIRHLFEFYSNDLGFLVGPGLDLALKDLVRHVQKEWRDRNSRLAMAGKRSMGDISDEFLMQWIMSAIDVDGDKCVTEEEAMTGFKKVVDDIE
jgi:hypothetical protein